jgi:hypothetical protein
MDDYLILRIRTETLRTNLGRIKRYLKTIPDRKASLEKLENQVSESRRAVVQASWVIRTFKTDFDVLGEMAFEHAHQQITSRNGHRPNEGGSEADSINTSWQEATKKLQTVVTHIQDAVAKLERAKEIVQEMHLRCFPIQSVTLDKSFNEKLEEEEAESICGKIVALEQSLRQTNVQRQLWDQYGREASEPCRKIFVEYADFLGGLAIRDAGFDGGISQVAEELIRTYKPSSKEAASLLALPARHEAIAMTVARVVRVHFPEWTIWALPFTAHEFWHVIAKNHLDSRLRHRIRRVCPQDEPIARESRFHDALADAFATFTMGPAYAFSAILLLLNPLQPYKTDEEHVSDDTRAKVIFRMLNFMDQRPGDVPGMKDKAVRFEGPRAYEKIRADLERAWYSAIDQVSPRLESSRADHESDKERSNKDSERLECPVEELWRLLEAEACAPFTVEQWNAVEDWPPMLLQGRIDEISIKPGMELRHVLNAVWRARIDPSRDPNIDLSDLADQLASKVIFPKGSIKAKSPTVERKG